MGLVYLPNVFLILWQIRCKLVGKTYYRAMDPMGILNGKKLPTLTG